MMENGKTEVIAEVNGGRSEADGIADMLMDFTDTLFYNFNTQEASQKAFERIADTFGICRATAHVSYGRNAGQMYMLFHTNAVIDENTHVEEKSLHSISGSTYIYRIYRRSTAAPLNMMQRRMLEFIFKTLHTYLNRQNSMEMSKYAQTHSMMLGCLNSGGMNEALKSLRREGFDFSQYATVFMNVRKFKYINAKVGFENGNKVLHQIVAKFRGLLREDELFAHIGGDNFTALLRQDILLETVKALNSMVCHVSHEGRDHAIEISFKMGIYCIEKGNDEITEMLERANIAYSFSRQSAKEHIVYCTAEKRREYEMNKLLESALYPAMENGEFLVYFQPKVDLASCRITGAEALSRWMWDGSLMPPDTFIPIFERNGMIIDIDFYVFEYVCRTLRTWMDSGIDPVTISVNFSKITLETQDFVKHLQNIAARHHVPVKYLDVEFTETCCMENKKKFKDILTELKEAGFCTSLDDFGKGYSSLNMLKNLDFDVLKLDRGFLSSGTSAKERDWIILRSTISMAKSLHMQVIAEGVENPEQIAMLRNLGCTKAQGYYFDMPLPEAEFLERLKAGRYEK